MYVSSLNPCTKRIIIPNGRVFLPRHCPIETHEPVSQYKANTPDSWPAGSRTSSLDGCDLWPKHCVRSQPACPPWLPGWRSVWCDSGPEEQVCSHCTTRSCRVSWAVRRTGSLVSWLDARQQHPGTVCFSLNSNLFHQVPTRLHYCHFG